MHYKTNGPSFLWPEPGHRLDSSPLPLDPEAHRMRNVHSAVKCLSISIFSCLETTAQGDALLAVIC